jgi:hypothetical protein
VLTNFLKISATARRSQTAPTSGAARSTTPPLTR